jgi:DNA polymerase I-like protein with 3'-5' exonuclease and polymerase domains
MVAQIHDELVFDFPKPKIEGANWALVHKIKSLMEQGGDDVGVPTPVNVEHHPVCWAEGVGI